jgi:thiol-disulfide isomerase/thioredoxin
MGHRAADVLGIELSVEADRGVDLSSMIAAGPEANRPPHIALLQRQRWRRCVPLAKGEVAAVEVAKQPALLPDLAFNGPDGKPTTLSAFRGKTVLVNLWATWCLPCLTEMPALDALQGALGGSDFEVVAINIDTRHPDKPRKWLADKNITRLGYYADPQAKVFQDIRAVKKVEGMPISLLVDPAGCELALLQGPAEWAGADAKTMISAALGRH